jgi:two-component system, NarL family, response regulator LiaR
MKAALKVAIIDHDQNHIDQLIRSFCHFEPIQAFSFSLENVFFEQFESLGPDYFIINRLPGLNGISILKHIKASNIQTPCLMYSSTISERLLNEAIIEGASCLISKYDSIRRIPEIMKEIATGDRLNPLVAKKVFSLFNPGFSKPNQQQSSPLTIREQEILQLLSLGLIYKEIANRLLISRETVKQHLTHIYHKIKVQNKVEAVNWYQNR